MKIQYRIGGIAVICLGAHLSLTPVSAHADPIPPTLPTNIKPLGAPQTTPLNAQGEIGNNAREKPKELRVLSNVTLDYDKSSQNSAEVLNAKISLTVKDAPFLSALDAVMNAADKTCRVECRQVHPVALSINVKDVPASGILDALAKLSGARLYVLPSKLIIAPEKALTDEEKKKARLYGVLLTAATLPDTPDAKALLKTNNKGKSILDYASTKISPNFQNRPLSFLMGGLLGPDPREYGHYSTAIIGPLNLADMKDPNRNVVGQDLIYGDIVASLAHLVGCELYMTPNYFVICAPGNLTSIPGSYYAQHVVPAFAPPSTTFTDPSANSS